MQERTWEHNELRIRQIWPNAQWGDERNELRQLFKRSLRNLNQAYLFDAIDAVKLKFSSHQPELVWFLKAYDSIAEARNFKPSGATSTPDKWWVDFEAPPKHSPHLMYAYSSDAVDRADAERIAKLTGGRIRNHSMIVEQDTTLERLRAMSRESIAYAVKVLRDARMISTKPLSPNVGNWKPATIGFVLGQIEKNGDSQNERKLLP